MKIGIDIDGVLADFNQSFIERCIAVTGRNLFPPDYIPTCWDYPQSLGYTKEETDAVWADIVVDPTFWESLIPYDEARMFLLQLPEMVKKHDVYFITSRPGIQAKLQTENWLHYQSADFFWQPTVLICSNKGAAAIALNLDVYIDDRDVNVEDVVECRAIREKSKGIVGCKTRVLLLNRLWNEKSDLSHSAPYVTRTDSVADVIPVALQEAA